MTIFVFFGILLASQFSTVHPPLSPQEHLPDTTDYLFATANHVLGTGRRAIKPTDLEVVLGPLLLTGEMDRQPTLEDYLLHTFTEGEETAGNDSFNRREASRVITNGLHGFRQRLRSKILRTTGDLDRAHLHLNLDAVPICTPEAVQTITRLAATRWLVDAHEEGREQLISDLQRECSLDSLQTQMLRELLLRNGGQFSYNAEDPAEKRERKNALQTLRDRLDAHFGEKTMRPYGGTYFALPALLAHVPGMSLEQVIQQHDTHFGPYLPVPQLLLNNRFVPPVTASMRSARLQRQQELHALTAARHHIEESGIESADLHNTSAALHLRMQEVQAIVNRFSSTHSVRKFNGTMVLHRGGHTTSDHASGNGDRLAGIEASLQKALAEFSGTSQRPVPSNGIHEEKIETPSGEVVIRRRRADVPVKEEFLAPGN